MIFMINWLRKNSLWFNQIFYWKEKIVLIKEIFKKVFLVLFKIKKIKIYLRLEGLLLILNLLMKMIIKLEKELLLFLKKSFKKMIRFIKEKLLLLVLNNYKIMLEEELL